MFNRFTKSATAVVVAAEQEARSLGSTSLEAEHLLLAFASTSPVLDHADLLAGLEADYVASLRAAGVDEETIASAPRRRPPRKVSFGASSKSALERAYKVAKARGDRRIEGRHVALGVLAAKRGTVPRALRAASLDADELRERL